MSRSAKLFRIAMVVAAVPVGCLSAGEGGCAPTFRSAEPCRCPPREMESGALAASAGADPAPPGSGGTLRIRVPSEPGTLLSLLSPHPTISRVIDNLVLEPLVEPDPVTGEPLPALALDWDYDPGARRWTFVLDPLARWHDGEPVTAGDVVFTFEHLLDPAGGAVARGDFVDLAEVKALDDEAVAFVLDRHAPDFPLALSRVMVLPAHVFGKERLTSHPATMAPVGSGPFRFSAWNRGRFIELVRVDDWRGGPAPLERLVYEVVPDHRVALDLFRAGRLDLVPDVEPSPSGPPAGGRLAAEPLELFDAWVYDTAGPLFAERAVREAVGRCIDRETLRCSVLACLADIVDHPWPRRRRVRAPAGGPLAYDIGEARRLLEEAGWRDAGDGVRERDGRRLEFELLIPDGARHLRRVAVVVRQDLARAGVRLRPAVVGPSTYAARLREHRFDAAIISFDNREPFDPWSLFHSSAAAGGSNYGRISDPLLDGLLEQWRAAVEPGDRRELEGRIGDRLAEQHWMTFTFVPWRQVLVREGVRGLPAAAPALDERRLRFAAGDGARP